MNKNVLIVICLLITAGAVAFGVQAMEKQRKLSKSLDEERYSRMVAEETSQKSAAKAATLEVRLKQADTKIQTFKEILDQEKGVNTDLKIQYDKLVRVKADLESRLKLTLEEKKAPPVQTVATDVQNTVVGAGAQ